MSFNNLPGEIRRLLKRIPKEVARKTNLVAMAIVETAAAKTPVDTSKALSNWQVNLGSSATGVLAARVPGAAGSTQQASIQVTVSAAQRVLKPRTVGTVIHVTNNAPYIEDLNNGTISQQPGGFYEAAIVAGRFQEAITKLDLS